MTPTDVVEEIMSQHWRPASEGFCPCWVCLEGRNAGCRARARYTDPANTHGRVWVDPAVCQPRTWHGAGWGTPGRL